jgi:hypothetical protein
LIQNSFTVDATTLLMSLNLSAGQATVPEDSTNNFYLLNNHPPCTADTLQSNNPERSITLPAATTAGKEITLSGVDFTTAGCFMAIFPKAGEKIVFQDHVRPGESNTQNFNGNAVVTGFGARLVSNGSGIWYGIAFF